MTPAQREAAERLAAALEVFYSHAALEAAALLRELLAEPQGEPVQKPERMGLDAIRSAIEDRDAIEAKYHDLAEHMVYHGNSVSWWHSKAIAYRDAIDNVWRELKSAGIVCDGKKTCADGVRELAAEPQGEPVAWRYRYKPVYAHPPQHNLLLTPGCWCESCDIAANGMRTRMSVCPQCGDKRCPRAMHHDGKCGIGEAP